MHARSALFDIYGDHLLGHGGRAQVAALVRLLAPLGIQPAAVRTAVSRMVRQGWLRPDVVGSAAGYALTERAERRLAEAAARIYRTPAPGWDGAWHLAVLQAEPDRRRRDRLAAQLGFLGWAGLSTGSWVGLRDADEVRELLATERLVADFFTVRPDQPRAFADRVWRLDKLGAGYASWLTAARSMVAARPAATDEEQFALRSELVHEWRKFLFTDPGLPAALLPVGWPGERAAEFFDAHAGRLAPAARRFVERCLEVRS